MTKKEDKFFDVLLFLGTVFSILLCFVLNTSNHTIFFFLFILNFIHLIEMARSHVILSRKIDDIKEQLISLNDFFIDCVDE